MPEFDRLTDFRDWIELEFVEREATPEPLMKFGIHLLDRYGYVDRWFRRSHRLETLGCRRISPKE